MQAIVTTMSFRAAWRFGCPHLAGHTVRLTREESGYYRVDHASGTLARVVHPQSVREPGGVPRAAEAVYPTKVPRWARDVIAANFAVREHRKRQFLSKLQGCRWPPPRSSSSPAATAASRSPRRSSAARCRPLAPPHTEGFGGALAIRAMLDPPKELDR